MSNKPYDTSRQLIKYFDPVRDELGKLFSKDAPIATTFTDINELIKINISENYNINTIELSDSIFLTNRRDIEETILNTINDGLQRILQNNEIKIKNTRLFELLQNTPSKLVETIAEFQNEFIKRLTELEKENDFFRSNNNQITVTITGGIKILSFEIKEEYFILSNKKEIESELLLLINKILLIYREKGNAIFLECKNKYFPGKNTNTAQPKISKGNK